jgi:hypothetical protein
MDEFAGRAVAAGGDPGGRSGSVIMMEIGKEELLFCEQKRSKKNFIYCGRWPGWCPRPQERKSFASFLQKRSACLTFFDCLAR